MQAKTKVKVKGILKHIRNGKVIGIRRLGNKPYDKIYNKLRSILKK